MVILKIATSHYGARAVVGKNPRWPPSDLIKSKIGHISVYVHHRITILVYITMFSRTANRFKVFEAIR